MSADQPLTGTDDRPVELIPDVPSTLRDWLTLLAGPAIWIGHFSIVYLAAEASCVPTSDDQYDIIGSDTLVVLTAVATVVAAIAAGAVAWLIRKRSAERRERQERDVVDLSRAGSITAIGAVIGVIAVGAPALYLDPVC